MRRGLLEFLLLFFIFNNKEVFCRSSGSFGSSNETRIVGGDPIEIENAPYQVFLEFTAGSYNYCGGSIVNERTILTAAHCLIVQPKLVTIRIGSASRSYGGLVYESQTWMRHPKFGYIDDFIDYDVAVIKLSENMSLDGVKTRAVKLATTEVAPGTDLFVTGWGNTSDGGQDSDKLLGVKVPTLSKEECKKSYPGLTSRMVCAGLKKGGKDACQGDSGGPAVLATTGEQVGVVSWGYGCASPDYPGVYAKVSEPEIVDFIKQNSAYASSVQLRIGSTDTDSCGYTHTSTNLIQHLQYDGDGGDYDVGIIKLAQDMTLDGMTARAVSLAEAGSETAVGTQLFVTGWGRTSDGGETSQILLGVKVPVTAHEDCAKAYQPIGIQITSRMICAAESGKDSCLGDSGGPAISQATGEQVGIVSFGKGCADPQYSGVYAKVTDSSIQQFIKQNSL